MVSIMIHVMCHIKIYDNAIQADLPGTVTRRCWHSLDIWSDLGMVFCLSIFCNMLHIRHCMPQGLC